MSKFEDYLKKQKIDPRRILVTSRKLEALTPEDRKIRLARRIMRGTDDKAKEKAKEVAEKTPHTGRPVTKPTLAKALAGGAIPSAARIRMLRAVNAVLTQKKKSEATAADLF